MARVTNKVLIALAEDALNIYKGALPGATDAWREVWRYDVRLFVEAAAKRFDGVDWTHISLVNDAMIAANFEWDRLADAVRRERKMRAP